MQRFAFALICAWLLDLVVGGIPAYSQNWSSCASDLDDVRRQADDANSAAQALARAKSDLDSKRSDLENCRNFPSTFDLMRDRCQSYVWDYNSKVDDYNSRLLRLKSEMSDLDDKIRDASSSCHYSLRQVSPDGRGLAPTPTPVLGPQNQWCAIYVKYKGRLPRNTLMDLCQKQGQMAAECGRCIDTGSP